MSDYEPHSNSVVQYTSILINKTKIAKQYDKQMAKIFQQVLFTMYIWYQSSIQL